MAQVSKKVNTSFREEGKNNESSELTIHNRVFQISDIFQKKSEILCHIMPFRKTMGFVKRKFIDRFLKIFFVI